MATFFEAHQVRIQLKMKLSNFYWYNGSTVVSNNEGYSVLIESKKLDSSIRKIVPNSLNGVEVSTILNSK